jgi:hypothetical protein
VIEIYFAGSITGGRSDAALYAEIVQLLQRYGTVLSEHVGNPQLSFLGESDLDDQVVHDRNIEWLERSHALATRSAGRSWPASLRSASIGRPRGGAFRA